MTTTKRIEEFRVSWTANHEQYYPGHSTVFTEYTHSGQGVGGTLREAFEDALEDLAQQDISVNELLPNSADTPAMDMLADLTAQVKEPGMIDWDIVKGYCSEQGEHTETCPQCEGQGFPDMECPTCHDEETINDENPDCAVCAGEWHYYVNVDVRVSEEEQ